MNRNYIILFFCMLLLPAHGQLSINPDSLVRIKPADSIRTIRRNTLKATGLILATNFSVWGFDRYIINGPYARINLMTMKRNFKSGFVWDNDMFSTNLFAHPYHGGVYFNAARSNGMNFWQSVPFAAGGSLLWEFLMENEPPGINDFIGTTLGGACLGEITYRISDRIIDDRTVGFDRFKRELLVTIISPIRGLTRLINGGARKHRKTRGNALPLTPVNFFTTLGYRIITDNTQKNNDISHMACYDLGLIYGNPYDSENEKPYDFFSINMSGNLFSQQPVISRLSALGLIFSKEINLEKTDRQLTLGIFQHFNFYQANSEIKNEWLTPYKISEAASIGPGLLFRSKLTNNIIFSSSAHLSGILLGGSQTDHFKYDKRDYNMGSGFSTKLNLKLEYVSKLSLYLNSEHYRIYSWVGYDPANPEPAVLPNVQGDIGNAGLSVIMLNFNYHLSKHIFVSAESAYYYRKSMYKYYTDVTHRVTGHKLSVGYFF